LIYKPIADDRFGTEMPINNMKTIYTVLGVAVAITVMGAVNAVANDQVNDVQISKTLKSVPAPEMPARAAQWVKQAKPDAKQATTIAVVKSALELKPASAPLVVAAIAKSEPAMAPTAAGIAAALQPKQAAYIARAAAAAAPDQAGKITYAVCREVPSEYRSVALAVSQVLTGANKEILQAIASAVPVMTTPINKALIAYGSASMSTVLDQAALSIEPAPAPASGAALAGNTTPDSRPPTIRPPYFTPPGVITNVTPVPGALPPTGRNYSAP
jgi:hypothetical protein